MISMEDAVKGRYVAEEHSRQQGGPPETALGHENYWLDMGSDGSCSSDETMETEFIENEVASELNDHSRKSHDDSRPVKKPKHLKSLVLKQEDKF